MKKRALLAATSLALLGLASFPALGQEAQGAQAAQPAQAAEVPAAERFNGTWRYNGTNEHGTQIIHRAIDRTVEPMNIFVRGIANGRLQGKNQLVQRIEIAVHGTDARIVFDGNRTYQTALGQWRAHTFSGESINVQIRKRGGSLVQLFRGDSGTRRSVYRMLPDGNMRLEVTVQSSSLPGDLNYQLVYRR